MKTYHDERGFILTAHMVHNWAVMKEEIVSNIVEIIRSEVLNTNPEIYDAIFSDQRRKSI